MRYKSILLCFLLFCSQGSVRAESSGYPVSVWLLTGLFGVVLGSVIIVSDCYHKCVLFACSKNAFKTLKIFYLLKKRGIFPDLFEPECGFFSAMKDYRVGSYSYPLLKSAIEQKNEELIQFLIQTIALRPDPQWLYQACHDNNTDLAKAYIQLGCEINKAIYNRDACDLYWKYNPHHAIHMAASEGNREIVELLVNKDANLIQKYKHLLLTSCAAGSFKGIAIIEWLMTLQNSDQIKLDIFHDIIERFIAFRLYDREETFLNWEKYKESEEEAVQALETIGNLFQSHKITVNDQKDQSTLLYLVKAAYGANKNCNRNEPFEMLKNKYPREMCYVSLLAQDKDLLESLKKTYAIPDSIIHAQCLQVFENEEGISQAMATFLEKYAHLDAVNDRGQCYLHVAIREYPSFISHFINNGLVSLKDLRRITNKNKTVLYVGYEKDPANLSCCTNKIDILKNEYIKKKFFTKELFQAARVLDDSFSYRSFKRFIKFCVQNGGDLHATNKKGKRPVDVALERVKKASKELWNSPYFIHREKVYHKLLLKTPTLADEEIMTLLRNNLRGSNHLAKLIMPYYYYNNIDLLVAQRALSKSYYYEKTKQQKERFKQEVFKQKCTQLLLEF